MPKFTFHIPVYNHDELEVEADNLQGAFDLLHKHVNAYGVDLDFPGFVSFAENVDEGHECYHTEDFSDGVSIFDENGEQI